MVLLWTLALLLLQLELINGHFFDQAEGDCPHGWRKIGYTCYMYNSTIQFV